MQFLSPPMPSVFNFTRWPTTRAHADAGDAASRGIVVAAKQLAISAANGSAGSEILLRHASLRRKIARNRPKIRKCRLTCGSTISTKPCSGWRDGGMAQVGWNSDLEPCARQLPRRGRRQSFPGPRCDAKALAVAFLPLVLVSFRYAKCRRHIIAECQLSMPAAQRRHPVSSQW